MGPSSKQTARNNTNTKTKEHSSSVRKQKESTRELKFNIEENEIELKVHEKKLSGIGKVNKEMNALNLDLNGTIDVKR